MVTTVLNRAELLAGMALLPSGRRRDALTDAVDTALSRVEATVPFTDECAAAYAELVALNRATGHPIATMDALVAAVARTVCATIATRTVKDFKGLGVEVVDPWRTTP